jgi:hypothetical protein
MIVAVLLDDHDLVAAVVAMPPAVVMAMIMVHPGVGAVPAVMMTAAFDDHGLRARHRRYRDRKCAKGRDDKSKLPHNVLLGVSVRSKLSM